MPGQLTVPVALVTMANSIATRTLPSYCPITSPIGMLLLGPVFFVLELMLLVLFGFGVCRLLQHVESQDESRPSASLWRACKASLSSLLNLRSDSVNSSTAVEVYEITALPNSGNI